MPSVVVSPKISTPYVRWCFKTDRGFFKSMGEKVNRSLERAFTTQQHQQFAHAPFYVSSSAAQTAVVSDFNDTKYLINFETMKQTNLDTNFTREIKRELVVPTPSASDAAVIQPENTTLMMTTNRHPRRRHSQKKRNTTTKKNTSIKSRQASPSSVPQQQHQQLPKSVIKQAQQQLTAPTLSISETKAKERTKLAYEDILKNLPSESDPLFERALALTISNILNPFTTMSQVAGPKHSDAARQLVRDRLNVDRECQEEVRHHIMVNLDGKWQMKTSRHCRKELGNNLARLIAEEDPNKNKPEWTSPY